MRSPRPSSLEFAREAEAGGVGARNVPWAAAHTERTCFAAAFRCMWCRRAGHANPAVMLDIYAHLLPGQQEGAAAVVDLVLRSALED